MLEPVSAVVDVAVDADVAFRMFVGEFGAWWPRPYTWAGGVLERIGIEERAGGHCYEIGPGGFRCDWGTVRELEPGSRLVLAWQIAPTRAPEPDPARASTVHVSFRPAPGGGTRVVLEHADFHRHGEGAEAYRAGMGSEAGWPWILQQYAAHVAHST